MELVARFAEETPVGRPERDGMPTPSRVLLVEDDDDYAQTVKRVIHRLGDGHAPDIVHDEPTALAAISRTRYDVVVSDYDLSPGNGMRVLEHVRRTWPQAHRILLTSAPDRARRALGDGDDIVHQVWDKRWELETIRIRLRAILRPAS